MVLSKTRQSNIKLALKRNILDFSFSQRCKKFLNNKLHCGIVCRIFWIMNSMFSYGGNMKFIFGANRFVTNHMLDVHIIRTPCYIRWNRVITIPKICVACEFLIDIPNSSSADQFHFFAWLRSYNKVEVP